MRGQSSSGDDDNIIIKTQNSAGKFEIDGSGNFVTTQNEPGSGNVLIGSFSLEKEKELLENNSGYMWLHDLIEGNRKEKWVFYKKRFGGKKLICVLSSFQL